MIPSIHRRHNRRLAPSIPEIVAGAGRRWFRLPGTASGPSGGPSPTPSASFQIERFDGIPDAELVAPVALWFTPANITGFLGVDGEPISEPAGDTNDYDPTAIEVFWSWDFGNPGYEPLVPSNLPPQMRDVNRAFVKRPCHVMHSPGAKTVNLFGYDTQGRWGTAVYEFADTAGDSPAIADPDGGFFTGREVFFSQDGIFPVGTPAADQCTTELAVQQRLTALWNTNGVTFGRLRLRRGEEYVDLASDLGNFRNLYIDSYGDPADPPPKQIRTGSPSAGTPDGPFAISNGGAGSPRIIDQDWQGPYDATTETGRRVTALIRNSARNGKRHLIHRVRISGAQFYHDCFQPDSFRTFSDVQITNWQDYGLFTESAQRLTLAIIGGDFAQHVDALSGTHHGTGNANFANLTNRHGPVRLAGETRDLYVDACSFFSRNGWSQRSGTGSGDTAPPTLAQACFRHGASASALFRNYASWTRCSFEGGAGSVHFVDLNGQDPSTAHISNILFDSNLMVASRDTEGLVYGKGRGMSARNNYFFVPATQHMYDPSAAVTFRHQSMIDWRFEGAVDPAGPSRVFVFSNTAYILADNAQVGAPATRVIANVAASHNPTIENNVLFAPNLSPALGGGLGPFTTPTLAGVQGRFKGTRFNFPPIGHESMGPLITAQSVRELSPGGTTGVADQEWISLPYPNYTGKNNGALGQVTRAMVESLLPSGAVRYHQVSLYDQNVKAAASAEAGGDGRVAFAFTDTAIRVQNRSGVTWLGNLWVLLDLRDRLMDYVPGTANPTSIPLLIPDTGSSLILGGKPDLWPAHELFARQRAGMIDADGDTPTGLNYAGAIAGPLA